MASAINKACHNGLLVKLISIKVPYYVIKILISFLSERKFLVKVGYAVSTTRRAKYGVPQRGVLSPTLYTIYINDIPVLENKHAFSLLK